MENELVFARTKTQGELGMELNTSMIIRQLPKLLEDQSITDIGQIAEHMHALKTMQNQANLWSYDRFTESGNAALANVITEYSKEKKECILWCLNNYLGLNRNPEVVQSVKSAADKFGTGSGTPAVSGGMSALHKEVQNRISKLLGRERTLLFSTGYTTNLGALSAIPGKNDFVILDQESHASMFDGVKLSGKEWSAFRHNNVENLEEKLKRAQGKYENVIVAVESAYSMSGDLCPIREIVALKSKYKFYIYVDEAHSFGFYGDGGRGYCYQQGVLEEIDFLMSTLSKSIPSIGGFVSAKEKFCTYMQCMANSFIFQTCMPPVDAATILASLDVIQANPGIAASLHEKNAYFRGRLREIGFDLRNSQSPIIPIYIPKLDVLFKCSKELYERGIFSVAVTYPAVKLREGRLRFTLTAAHTQEQIDKTVDEMARLAEIYGIAKVEGADA